MVLLPKVAAPDGEEKTRVETLIICLFHKPPMLLQIPLTRRQQASGAIFFTLPEDKFRQAYFQC